jgi:CRISPR-associated protein Cmr3
VDHLFAMPPALAQDVSTAPGVALTFCTPALFSQGWKPGWLDNALCGEFPGISGLRLRLIACALERWQGISGWDLARQQPKPARKAVAAGSTYWFEILERPTDAQWPQALWLASLSDTTQDRRDGWGAVIPRIAQDTDFSLCTQG